MHDPGIQTMDLMHTARLFIPLRHECWCFSTPLYGVTKSDWDWGMHVTCWLVSDVELALLAGNTILWCMHAQPGPECQCGQCHACAQPGLRLRPDPSPSHYATRQDQTIHLLVQMCTDARAIKPNSMQLQNTLKLLAWAGSTIKIFGLLKKLKR